MAGKVNTISKQAAFAACGALLASSAAIAQSPSAVAANGTLKHVAARRAHARPALAPHAKSAASDDKPADVFWSSDNRLFIRGNGSDLSRILESVSTQTGILVEGSAPRQAVFGAYGPGPAQAILSELLAGSGADYLLSNVDRDGLPHRMEIGTPNGAPSNVASPRQDAAAVHPASMPDEAASAEALGPGAIAHVPPNERTEGTATPEEESARIRQSMEKLRHIEEQQNAAH